MPLDNDNALIGDWTSVNAGEGNEPPGGDLRSQGDDQIRRLKGTVRRHFPGFVGTWSSPKTVDASEDQINGLSDYVPGNGTVENRLAALEAESAKFPGGGVVFLMFRNQVSAIPGWAQATDPEYDGAMLRVINDASALSQGGSANPINLAGADVPGHSHSISSLSGGGHEHPLHRNDNAGGSSFIFAINDSATSGSSASPPGQVTAGQYRLVLPNSGDHTHTGNTEDNTGPPAWEPKYFDGIVASKN